MPEIMHTDAMAPEGTYSIIIEDGMPVLRSVDNRRFWLPATVAFGVKIDWTLRVRFLGNPYPTDEDRTTPMRCIFVPAANCKDAMLRVIDERCANMYLGKMIPLAALAARGDKYGLPHVDAIIDHIH